MAHQPQIILIVDDDQTNLKMLAKVLQRHYRVCAAHSGAAALEILKREDVSVLISDQCMPGMLGTELLSRAHTINPDMVCLLMTGSNDAEVYVEALTRSGAVRVIKKPWDPDKLTSAVQTLVEKYEKLRRQKESMKMLQ